MGHHLTSIIFHGLNTFLVIFLVFFLAHFAQERRLIQVVDKTNGQLMNTPLLAGAITGLLFGLHPLHVESVAWISERKDVLYAFFFLLSMLSYLKYISSSQKRQRVFHYGLCLLFFIFSLMSKPMAITLPIVLIILDYFPLERLDLKSVLRSNRKVLIEKLPFFVLSIGSSVITVMAQQSEGAIHSFELIMLGDRVLVALRALSFYLYKMIWPINLAPLYPYPSKIAFFMAEYLLSFILFLAVTIFCISTWKKQKIWSAVWAYYVITLLPVLGIVGIGAHAAADRYTYLPSLGPFLLLGLGVSKVLRKSINHAIRKLFSSTVIAILLVVLSYFTMNQIKIWQDTETLWYRDIKVFPKSAFKAYNNLGEIYKSQGLIDKARIYYETAIKINPQFPQPYSNLGVILRSQGRIDEAIKYYQIALKLNPDFIDAHKNLGFAYILKGDKDKAIQQLQHAVKLDPSDAKAQLNLGIAYKSKGLTEKANEHLRIARQLNAKFYKAKAGHK
jgi:tetratricopeptide (TPR) repeat protein